MSEGFEDRSTPGLGETGGNAEDFENSQSGGQHSEPESPDDAKSTVNAKEKLPPRQIRRKDSANTGPTPTDQAYNELVAAYGHFNKELFNNELEECLLTLTRSRRFKGFFWSDRFVNRAGKKTHEIALNPGMFEPNAIALVFAALVHQMAHQWQHDIDVENTPAKPGYHNKEWAAKMKEIGLCPSDTESPGGAETGEQMSQYVIAGGKFEEACKTLLDRKIGLAWYDRHPVDQKALVPKAGRVATEVAPQVETSEKQVAEEVSTVSTSTGNTATEGGNESGVASDPDAASTKKDKPGKEKKPKPAPPPPPPKAEPLVAQWVSEEEIQKMDIHREEVKKTNRNKSKYSCVGPCPEMAKLWGKPNLKILCMACNTKMQEVTE